MSIVWVVLRFFRNQLTGRLHWINEGNWRWPNNYVIAQFNIVWRVHSRFCVSIRRKFTNVVLVSTPHLQVGPTVTLYDTGLDCSFIWACTQQSPFAYFQTITESLTAKWRSLSLLSYQAFCCQCIKMGALTFSMYSYCVHHHPGKANCNADALSHYHCLSCSPCCSSLDVKDDWLHSNKCIHGHAETHYYQKSTVMCRLAGQQVF